MPKAQRLKCPDCGEASDLASLRPVTIRRYGAFLDCPRCAVGSPRDEWRAPAVEAAQCEICAGPHAGDGAVCVECMDFAMRSR